MKNLKMTTAAILTAGILALITACNMNADTHEHTFKTEWSSDETNHWHAASCEHKDEVKDKAAHTWDDGVVTKAATKDSTGIKTFTCTVCNKTKTEEIAKLTSDSDNTGTGNTDKENTDKDKENEDKGTHKHTYATEWTADATSHWHAASCEHKDEVKDKAAHTFGEWKITTQPTEEAEGKKERECSVCGYKATETVAKLDHVHAKGTHHDAVAGTCVKKGTVEYYDCVKATCEIKLDKEGKPLATIEGELKPSNHTGTATTWTKTAGKHKETYDCCGAVKTAEADHSFGNWIVKTPATCGAEGVRERECSVCNYKETSSIAKVPHTFATDWSKDATNHWHAATCGHTAEVSDKAAHTFGDWTVKTPATCTTDGSKERLCKVCSYIETAVIEKTGHSYATAWTTDATNHWHTATCEHTTEVSDKAVHTFGDWIVKTPATCTTDGSKERLCKVCSYTETAVIEKTGHSFATEWTIDATHHWHKATCGHTTEVSDKAEHTFNGTVCTVCNCEKPVAQTITVTKGDNTYEDPQNN